MKTVRNITLVSLLAAGVMSVPAAHAHYKQLQNDVNRWAEGSAIKATVTFTEPNQHGMDFAAATTGAGQFTHFVGVKEQLDWAVGLEHRLASGWTRLFLDYDHYHADDSSSFTGAQTNLLGLGAAAVSATGEYNLHSDSAKLGMRHRVNHSRKSIIDLGAALSWVDMDRDFTVVHTNGGGATATLSQHADFDAFGPFFDVTVKHYTHSRNRTGLNIQMYAGAGLLYTETKFNSSIAGVENFDREKVKGVSAELIAKLGIGWDYRFCNRTMLSTTLGYMFMNYTDAFNYGGTGGAFARFAASGSNNVPGLAGAGNASGGFPFTRQGPYLEFKWSGANF